MAIEKLNDNSDVLDMTAPPRDDVNSKIPNKNEETIIDMAPKGNVKTKPQQSRMKVSTSGGTRNTVSIADLKGEEKVTHGNPTVSKVHKEADSILDMDNPDSMFNQYFDNKVKEYNDRMQVEEEKVRDAVESGELDPNSEVAKSWLGDPNEEVKNSTVRTDDIDFDDEDDEEEEEETMPEDKNQVVDDNLVDDGYDDEEEEELLEDEEELSDEEDDDDYADEEIDLSDEEDEEEEEEESETQTAKTVKSEVKKATPISSKITGMDLSIKSKKSDLTDDDEEEDEDDSNNDDELVSKLRKMATEKLKPKSASIDISNFVIGKSSVKNINPIVSVKEDKIAKWVLINQEQIVLMREFSGVELQTFVETANANTASTFSRRMRMVYNHIESSKPSFEKWLKSTPFSDLDHYYFGVYVASFNGTNYMPVDCKGGTKCPEGTFVSDNVPIMDLVKFTNNDVKKKFKKIYKEETMFENPEGKFVYNVVPIDDKIAIGFKQPMLYDYIESISVDDTFARKYQYVLTLMPYIDNFYSINQANGTLDPIGYNKFPDNSAKTFRSKVRKYNTLLSYFGPDSFSMIEAYANDIRDNDDGIKYIIPSLTCPYCGTESDEMEMTAESLVFTRYQLGALVNTTLK